MDKLSREIALIDAIQQHRKHAKGLFRYRLKSELLAVKVEILGNIHIC